MPLVLKKMKRNSCMSYVLLWNMYRHMWRFWSVCELDWNSGLSLLVSSGQVWKSL